MLKISDPYDLKPPDVYRQAKAVASKTTRASDGQWYRDSGDIACQWHLWFDGGKEICSATLALSDGRWRNGPTLPLASLTTGEGVSGVLGELLTPAYFGHKPKALGVILHLSDEFTLAEIAPTAETGSEGGQGFDFLRYNLVDAPRDVLADSEVSETQTSWRLLPFWGASADSAQNSTAVALPRSREPFLAELVKYGEQAGIPVRVSVTSGPLEALATLAALQPDLPDGCLVAIPYVRYTALFVLSNTGELLAARSLTHRSGGMVPNGLGQIAWNMAMSAEMVGRDDQSPRMLVVSQNPQVIAEAARELDTAAASQQVIEFATLNFGEHQLLDDIPGKRPEFLLYDPQTVAQFRSEPSLLAQTVTFKSLWDGWAAQNFYDTAKVDAQYPSRSDLQLLRASNWLIYLLFASMIGLGGWTVYSFFNARSHPSWTLTPEQVAATEANNTKLLAERKQIDTTESLLMPRSQGWSTLELLLQLFPENADVRLESFDFQITPGTTVAGGKVGLTRQWKLKGLGKPLTMQRLNQLSSQRGLTAFFEQLVEATGDTSYAVEPTRQVELKVTESRNSKFKADGSPVELVRDPTIAYPYTFEATMSQTLTEKDPLALPVAKPF